MGPRGLGPKTIKSLKIMRISVFFQHGKDAHQNSARVHLTTAPDHWYGHFWSKLCFWKFVKQCQKYQNWINFGYIPDGPKQL